MLSWREWIGRRLLSGRTRVRILPRARSHSSAVEGLNPSAITTYGALAERQGIALLTRRDLRVGQVRLLHSPPLRGLGIWVVHQPSKLTKRVRVSQPAPLRHVRLAAQDARLSSGMTSVQ